MSKDEVYDHADALWRAEATRLRRAFNDEFSALGARMARAGVMFGSHHIEESGQAASIELSKRGTAIFRAIIAAHATVGDKINRKWSAPRFKAWSSHHIDSEAQELGAHWLGGEGTRWAGTRDAYMRHILAARDAEQARAASLIDHHFALLSSDRAWSQILRMGALAIATLLFLFAAISALSDWDGAQKTAQRVWGNLVGSGTTVQ